MSGWRWRQKGLERFPCKLAVCKSSWWVCLLNTTVFYLAPPPNALYMVSYESACAMKTGLKGSLVKGNQKGLLSKYF